MISAKNIFEETWQNSEITSQSFERTVKKNKALVWIDLLFRYQLALIQYAF